MSKRRFQIANALSRRIQRVEEKGCSVKMLEDGSYLEGLLDRLGKDERHPSLSPQSNDFTDANCFWAVLLLGGEEVGVIGARFDDLSGTPISDFWSRSLSRQYGISGSPRSVCDFVNSRLQGRGVYFGDFYISKPARKTLVFAEFAHVALYHACLTWDPDFYYAFMREGEVLRGASINYGLVSTIKRVQKWPEDVDVNRGNAEACCYSLRSDVDYLATLDVGVQ